MPTFDYAAHFGRIKEIERPLLHKNEIQWTEAYAKPERPVDVLLYLGCNVLQTAHLACEVVNVFKSLGVNFHAVGGPQFCCGIVHHRNGDLAPATRLAKATVTKFESYGAPQVVMWCPSCHLHFDEVIRKDLAPSFSITHATAFLAERAAQLPFRQPVPVRAAVHTHTGRPQQDRDAEAALKLLGAVPGVRVMGTIAAPELSYHCGVPMNEAVRARFLALRDRLLGKARDLGADTLVTLYHGCQREWCERESETLGVRNYISLVAEALGCHQENRFKAYKRLGDPDAIARLAREQGRSHGWDEKRIRETAAKHFDRTPERNGFTTATGSKYPRNEPDD